MKIDRIKTAKQFSIFPSDKGAVFYLYDHTNTSSGGEEICSFLIPWHYLEEFVDRTELIEQMKIDDDLFGFPGIYEG